VGFWVGGGGGDEKRRGGKRACPFLTVNVSTCEELRSIRTLSQRNQLLIIPPLNQNTAGFGHFKGKIGTGKEERCTRLWRVFPTHRPRKNGEPRSQKKPKLLELRREGKEEGGKGKGRKGNRL